MKTESTEIRSRLRGARSLAIVAMLALVALMGSVAAAQESGARITVDLKEYQGSGVTGTAVLIAQGSAVSISMRLTGAAVTGGHPTHIHTGTCENFDPNPLVPLVTFVLDPVDNAGVSETVEEDLSLDDLMADDYVILVHESPENLTHYLVCGEIPHHVDAQAVPATGSGSSRPGAGRELAAATVLLLGVGALVAAIAARRWRRYRA